jgi:hypothetical protein
VLAFLVEGCRDAEGMQGFLVDRLGWCSRLPSRLSHADILLVVDNTRAAAGG